MPTKVNSPLRLVATRVPLETDSRLDAVAERLGCKKAELIRNAIHKYQQEDNDDAEAPSEFVLVKRPFVNLMFWAYVTLLRHSKKHSEEFADREFDFEPADMRAAFTEILTDLGVDCEDNGELHLQVARKLIQQA